MIFGIIILLILAGITYFHFVQGGLSSAISAFSAVIAALLAMGYYESIVVSFEPGKMADYAPGMVLIALYGLSYIIIRVLMDTLIAGNIRLPLWVDRGAAIGFGLVAAMCATGVFAYGAQLMPFGPSLVDYTMYPLRDRGPLQVGRVDLGQSYNQDQDLDVTGELTNDELNPTASVRSGLLVPTDQFIVGLTKIASDGAYQNTSGNSFSYVHPDPLLQAFANRVGPDLSGRRVIINAKRPAAEVPKNGGLFLIPKDTLGLDSEIPAIRPEKKSLTYEKRSDRQLLVVRTSFAEPATDSADALVRITPAAARLVLNGVTYYPIGTMLPNGRISLNRIDDVILVKGSADFVYQVDDAALTKAVLADKVKANALFIEFKMMARVDLEGREIADRWSAGGGEVLQKKASPAHSPPAPAAPAAPVPANPAPAAAAPKT